MDDVEKNTLPLFMQDKVGILPEHAELSEVAPASQLSCSLSVRGAWRTTSFALAASGVA